MLRSMKPHPIFLILHVTLSTSSVAVRSFSEVRFNKWMALVTMSFSFINCSWSHASQGVLNLCYWLKMIWVNTTSNSTKMVERLFFYLTFGYHIRKSMGLPMLSFKSENTIPMGLKSTSPEPASTSFFNVIPKVFYGIFSHSDCYILMSQALQGKF